MSARCYSCQASVPDGVEICEICRTAQIPKVNLESLSGPALARLKGSALVSTFHEDIDEVPFSGRSDALGQLGALVERALSQQKLLCAVVHGAPGLGKSRLLRELSRLCVEHLGLPRERILIGSMPGEGASPLSAFIEQLRTRCDIQAAEQQQSAREKVFRTCRMLLPAVRASEVAHSLDELLGLPFPEGHLPPPVTSHHFSTLLPSSPLSPAQLSPSATSPSSASQLPLSPFGSPTPATPSEKTPLGEFEKGANGKPRAYVALKRFLTADALSAPLVLLFDEMENATDETLGLLHYLEESLLELPVFIGIFARGDFVERNPNCGSSTAGSIRIELPPMPTAEAVELFCAAVSSEPEELPPALLQLIETRGEGSPRKLVELYHLLIEAQVLSFAPADAKLAHSSAQPVWNLQRLAELGLPPELEMEDLIQARLAAMPQSLRTFLEKAAVCGEHFYFDAVLMLERCQQAGLAPSEEKVREDRAADDGIDLSPADPEGPDIDELLSNGDRAAMNEALEHLLSKGLMRAVRDSRLRGEREYRFAYPPWRDIIYHNVPLTHRRLYHRLIAHWLLLHQEKDSEELLETVARHMERAGHGAAAAFFYRRAAGLASLRGFYAKPPRLLLRALSCLGSADIGLRVGLWHDLGAALVHKGDFDAAQSAYEKLLRLAHALSVHHYLAQSHYALGQIFRHKGEPSIALEHLTRAFDEFTELSDAQGISDALDDLGQVLWLLGRTEEALDRAGRALELRRRLAARRKVALSLLHIGAIEQHRGLLDPAIGCYEEALRKHDGDPHLLAACLEALGSIDLLRGHLAGARARFEQGLELIQMLGPSPLYAILLCRLGEALLQEGLHDEAEARLEEARELAYRLSDRRALAEIQRLLGLLLLRRNQHKAALDCCQKALDQAQKNGLRHEIARALLALGEVHAATLFDETVEGAHPAWECFRRSVALLREVGDQAELAIALYQLGRHLIERGRTGPARNTLREAEQIASRLHMRLAADMHQMLAEL